jgi:hypothetical protein
MENRGSIGAALLCAIAGFGGMANAQTATLTPPTLDRWMYPFNGSPGSRTEASVFGSINTPGFDDRDAQYLVGWDTGATYAAGLNPGQYTIVSAKVHAWISEGGQFAYDPTPDPLASWYATSDPDYAADTDPGRSLEVYGAGYRNGWAATGANAFLQTSTFASSQPINQPAEGDRNVFAATYDAAGNATDISRQVRLKQASTPWGVGLTSTVAPGAIVPADTEFVFDLNVADPAIQAYFQRSLASGRVNLIITSLQEATGGPGGGTSTAYGVFYTKFNALGVALGETVSLELNVKINSCYANCDGSTSTPTLTAADFTCFLSKFRDGVEYANCDGSTGSPTLTAADFTCFLGKFRAGCP